MVIYIYKILGTTSQWFPNFLGPRLWKTICLWTKMLAGGWGVVNFQGHYIYYALYFCYYISSTSDHQALDPGG